MIVFNYSLLKIYFFFSVSSIGLANRIQMKYRRIDVFRSGYTVHLTKHCSNFVMTEGLFMQDMFLLSKKVYVVE